LSGHDFICEFCRYRLWSGFAKCAVYTAKVGVVFIPDPFVTENQSDSGDKLVVKDRVGWWVTAWAAGRPRVFFEENLSCITRGDSESG